MLSTKWVCRTECSFCILLVPMVYCIMTDLVLSTKWVNRIECSFADRPDSTNGDSVLPYCQQNGSAVQNVVSVIDPLQQIMTLKIGETTNYTAGSSIHINKFVDQQYGSTTQIVVSAPTSTNGVIPNRQNWYGELYAALGLVVTAGNGAAAKTNFETAAVVRSGEMKPIAAKCLSRQQIAKRTPAGGEVTTN